MSVFKTIVYYKNKPFYKNNILATPISETNKRILSIPRAQNSSLLYAAGKPVTQPAKILELLEPQICPSYRQPFTPLYPRLINLNPAYQRGSNAQRKMSHASSRRTSTIASFRKRDSEISQLSATTLQDMQNRFSLPVIHKIHRQSVVATN